MKEKRENIIDFIILFLMISYSYFRMLGMNNKIWLIFYISILVICMIYKIFYIKFAKKEFYKILFFFGVCIFSTVIVGEVDFLIPVLVAISFIKTDSKKILKSFLKISIVLYLMVLILYFLGIAQNKGLIRIQNENIKNRNSLGFSHVNQTFLFFLPIQLCIYLLYSKRKVLVNSVILICSTVLFFLTDCRTGYFCTIIFFIIYNVPIIIENRIYNVVGKIIFIIFTVVSIFVASKYGEDGSNKINNILSLRPYYIHEYLEQDTLITIKGNHFNKNIPLDNLYVYLLEEKGIVLYFIYAYIYIYSFESLKNSLKYKTVVTIFLIYGLFEAYIIWSAINFILVLQLKNIILKDKEKNFIEDE